VRICLDTSAYSAFKRGHANVREAIAAAEEITLPAIVIGELIAGFRAGSREQANRAELERFLVWIAAVAMERGLELHTTDPHFERVPLVIVRRHRYEEPPPVGERP
jgi:predicted nucleic acid-binding protein